LNIFYVILFVKHCPNSRDNLLLSVNCILYLFSFFSFFFFFMSTHTLFVDTLWTIEMISYGIWFCLFYDFLYIWSIYSHCTLENLQIALNKIMQKDYWFFFFSVMSIRIMIYLPFLRTSWNFIDFSMYILKKIDC
jgi:hypothetical protein